MRLGLERSTFVLFACLFCLLGLAAPSRGDQALVDAIRRGDLAAVTARLDGSVTANALTKVPHGTPLLHLAIDAKQEAIVRLLLERGADPNRCYNPTGNRFQPLARASDNFGPELLRVMIARGARLDQVNVDGETPLLYAARQGKLEAVKLFLEGGADAKAQSVSPFGGTALHSATLYERVEVMTLLLDRGLDINARNHRGWTPLMVAAARRCRKALDLLIARGALLTVAAHEPRNQTALDLARSSTGRYAKEVDPEIVKTIETALAERGGKEDLGTLPEWYPLTLADPGILADPLPPAPEGWSRNELKPYDHHLRYTSELEANAAKGYKSSFEIRLAYMATAQGRIDVPEAAPAFDRNHGETVRVPRYFDDMGNALPAVDWQTPRLYRIEDLSKGPMQVRLAVLEHPERVSKGYIVLDLLIYGGLDHRNWITLTMSSNNSVAGPPFPLSPEGEIRELAERWAFHRKVSPSKDPAGFQRILAEAAKALSEKPKKFADIIAHGRRNLPVARRLFLDLYALLRDHHGLPPLDEKILASPAMDVRASAPVAAPSPRGKTPQRPPTQTSATDERTTQASATKEGTARASATKEGTAQASATKEGTAQASSTKEGTARPPTGSIPGNSPSSASTAGQAPPPVAIRPVAALTAVSKGVDRVGAGEAFRSDGHPDGVGTVRLCAPGRSLTALEIRNVDGVFTVYDTVPGNGMWILGVDLVEAGPGPRRLRSLNRPDGSLEPLLLGPEEVELELSFQDGGAVAQGGTHFKVTLTFADGMQIVVPVASGR